MQNTSHAISNEFSDSVHRIQATRPMHLIRSINSQNKPEVISANRTLVDVSRFLKSIGFGMTGFTAYQTSLCGRNIDDLGFAAPANLDSLQNSFTVSRLLMVFYKLLVQLTMMQVVVLMKIVKKKTRSLKLLGKSIVQNNPSPVEHQFSDKGTSIR